MTTAAYPNRPQYFAHRFIRLMTKTALAMEVGVEGFALLTIIAMQEDACRYTKPVAFWNSQLLILIGLDPLQEAKLRRVREKCVALGWLNYSSGAKGRPAHYYVMIPDAVTTIEDGPCDETEKESDAHIAEVRRESDENPTRMRRESDNIHTSPYPLPGGERAETLPPASNEDQKTRNREALAKLLRRRGLPASQEAVTEWADLLTGVGECDDVDEVIEVLPRILATCKDQGVYVLYAKHARVAAEARGAAKLARIAKQQKQEIAS